MGCHYEVRGDQLVAVFSDEECYCWDIIRENGDIHIVKTEGHDEISNENSNVEDNTEK